MATRNVPKGDTPAKADSSGFILAENEEAYEAFQMARHISTLMRYIEEARFLDDQVMNARQDPQFQEICRSRDIRNILWQDPESEALTFLAMHQSDLLDVFNVAVGGEA